MINPFIYPVPQVARNTLNEIFEDVTDGVRKELKNQNLWISVGETTDTKGRQVANLIIGTLNVATQFKGHLINVGSLDKTNNVTIARFIIESLASFFLTDKAPFEKFLINGN